SNTKTQPVLYDTPPASTGQSHFQSVSRATPVQRPRPETAIPFVPDEYKERLRKSKLARSRTLSESFDEPDLYSIEEHRDELSSVPSTTHQYSTLHPKSQNYQSLTYHSNTDKHSNTSTTGYFDSTGNDASNILSEVESLLSLHLPSSTSYSSSLPNSLKYQQKDHPTAAAVTTPARTSSSQFASQSSSSSTYHPQLYPIPSQHQQSAQRLQHLYSPTTINCTTPHSFSSSSSNNVSTNQRLLPTYSCTIPNSSHYNSSTLPFNKPQVYCTEQREVERFTYRPGAVTPNTTITSSPSTQSTSTKITPAKIQRYPIVELSIPKSDSSVNQSKSVDHHDYHRLIGDYSDTTQTDSNNRSSYSRYSSNQPTVPESPLNVYSHHHHHHHHSHQPPESEQSFSQANQEPIKTSSSSQSHSSRSNQTSSSNHSNRVTIDLLSPSSLDRSFYEQAGLSGVRGGIGCESRIKTSTKPLDISSLDALLESTFSDLYDDDMSKSTKEWHSSFSTMRDRFGNHDLLDEFVNRFDDFTTNGSLTLPRRGGGLSKSASQGSMTLGRRSAQSSSYSRNNSLLADAVDAVERTVSDASESSRKNSRQELNDFWAETVRNSSNSGSIQRPSGQLNAAQRLEMLHESLDMQRGMEMRYSRGERIAERRAQFLKETIQSSNSASSPSALTDRFFTQRSVPSSNGYMGMLSFSNLSYINQQNEASFQIDVSENETTTTIHKKNKEANESAKQPNFSALDNAVAELSTTTTSHQQYTVIRSGGCARFPTDDLNSLSPTSRKDSSNNSTQLHSPSPDAGSDTGSAYNAPSGLPHPKPKHNIREQLIQAGFELRGC
ncbi:unnamed protein product, partial [Anisakis simplex]|uniref:SH2 domain-containing protein n=1 Tax=Anisakis simplex TaxID=6269 RepID=A0A0M3K7U7_ANISI